MKVVKIVFVDARRIEQVWQDEIATVKPAEYVAVGFQVKATREYVCLAQGFLPKTDSMDASVFRGVLVVPRVLIKEMKELGEKK